MARVIKISLLILLTAALKFNVSYASDKPKPNIDAQPLEIINITPTGEDVPASRQITFQFNRPVVPLGRMDRDASEIPIVITPEVKAQWRWLDAATLALMLDEGSALNVKTLLPEDIIGLKIQAIHNDPGNRNVVDAPDIQQLLSLHRHNMDMGLVREYFRIFEMETLLDEWLDNIKQ